MIVATAGHVDHGKTTLVKALTGVDTDRLQEEQRRGMTIELGFAYADIDAATAGHHAPAGGLGRASRMPMGFIDVPGHERLLRNMLAGVTSIDLALLVVAADDGPMPQTHEHLALLDLLAVPQLVVVLSKTDRVDAAQLAQARRAVSALLAGSRFADAPVLAVAATTGDGLPALRQHLAQASRGLARRATSGQFRLAIDRSFSLAGAGRIVTGTVLSGQLRLGDAVLVSPQGTPARVRGLHVHTHSAELACAGQRCALNLSGPELKRAEPQRGDWVVAVGAHAPSDRLDVQLQWLRGQAQPPGARATLQLHLGAAAVGARVALLDETAAAANGGSGLAQLVLERPLAAAHGDRFVLRDPAANRSLAGGWVIDPFGLQRGRASARRLAELAALRQPEPAQALQALLRDASDGVDLAWFARVRNLSPDETAALQAGLRLIDASPGPLAMHADHWQAQRARLLAALDRWHLQHPDRLGPDDAALRGALGKGTGTTGAAATGATGTSGQARALQRAALAELQRDGLVQRSGLRLHRSGHQPCLAADEQALLARVHALLRPAGLRPPIVGELAGLLGLAPEALPGLVAQLAALAERGCLVRVAPNRWFLPDTVAELVAHAGALAAASLANSVGSEGSAGSGASLDAAGFRDRTGIGRNLTVQVLEFLDRSGITRFDGTRHRWLG